jgi:hypothetical protein
VSIVDPTHEDLLLFEFGGKMIPPVDCKPPLHHLKCGLNWAAENGNAANDFGLAAPGFRKDPLASEVSMRKRTLLSRGKPPMISETRNGRFVKGGKFEEIFTLQDASEENHRWER